MFSDKRTLRGITCFVLIRASVAVNIFCLNTVRQSSLLLPPAHEVGYYELPPLHRLIFLETVKEGGAKFLFKTKLLLDKV